MNVFDSMNILASGLSAERIRIDITTSNMANAQTTRTPEGGPYKRQDPVFTAQAKSTNNFSNDYQEALKSVVVSDVVADDGPPRLVFDPSHPDANKEGYVAMPNINMVEEMVNMMTASLSYEAQITAMHGITEMAQKALSI